MGNDLRGQADLAIGSETLTLRYDFGTLREAQLALSLGGGVELFEAIQRLDFNAILTLLWLGLRAGGKKDIKLADVGKMDFAMPDAIAAINSALTSALGKPKEAEGKA